MNADEQAISHRLWISILDLDLQLYKGSIYKLRWGTPGGLDMALPCYDRAIRTLDDTTWPQGLGETIRSQSSRPSRETQTPLGRKT